MNRHQRRKACKAKAVANRNDAIVSRNLSTPQRAKPLPRLLREIALAQGGRQVSHAYQGGLHRNEAMGHRPRETKPQPIVRSASRIFRDPLIGFRKEATISIIID